MISSIRQREGLPVVVKSEPVQVHELESAPFGVRMEMRVGSEPVPGAIVDKEDNKDDNFLQEKKIKALQMLVAQLEKQLADSTNLAAERLSKITKLEASLSTISHERDLFKAESLKWRGEIISFVGKFKHLEEQVYGSLDMKAPAFEADMLVPLASALSQTDGCQNSESEQMQHQLGPLVHVNVGDLLTGLPHEKEISTSTLVVPRMEVVPDNVSSVELGGDVECMTSSSSLLNMDKVDELSASVAAGSSSCHEMQTGHDCVASRADKNVLPGTINSQSVPLLNSTGLEPMHLLCKTVVKEEIIPVDAQSVAEENSCTFQKIDGPNEILASNSSSKTDYENQCLPTLAKISEEDDNNEKDYNHVNAPDKHIQVKVENVDNCVESLSGRLMIADSASTYVKREIMEENSAGDLDDVSLKERLKMLIASKSCGTQVSGRLNSQQCDASHCSAIFAAALQEDGRKTMKELVKAADVSGSEYHHLSSVTVNTKRPTLHNKRRKTGMDAGENKPEAPDVKGASFDSVKHAESGSTHRRKRKKTATDNIETALEEDAPGLLQILMDSGVDVDEIKLYGAAEDEEPIEITDEAGFTELEVIISKLFTQSSSLLKFAPLRHAKGSRVNYCLACLVSLVEQTRYLRFRKWPVEWGWCRDLQSFIFVFEKHNRIVLERPEYGFATYFFELVGSFPIDWQIKRLVTAMKLASFSRVSLIENKPLLVGDDLTEREAQVLEEYGWIPNTGLGTMLNYYDRVVHDKKNEDSSEWRSKIGRLLREGFDGGTIVAANLPKKVIKYKGLVESRLKLEI